MGMKFYNKQNLFVITERISVFFEGRVWGGFPGEGKREFSRVMGAMFYILFRVITLNRVVKINQIKHLRSVHFGLSWGSSG